MAHDKGAIYGDAGAIKTDYEVANGFCSDTKSAQDVDDRVVILTLTEIEGNKYPNIEPFIFSLTKPSGRGERFCMARKSLDDEASKLICELANDYLQSDAAPATDILLDRRTQELGSYYGSIKYVLQSLENKMRDEQSLKFDDKSLLAAVCLSDLYLVKSLIEGVVLAHCWFAFALDRVAGCDSTGTTEYELHGRFGELDEFDHLVLEASSCYENVRTKEAREVWEYLCEKQCEEEAEQEDSSPVESTEESETAEIEDDSSDQHDRADMICFKDFRAVVNGTTNSNGNVICIQVKNEQAQEYVKSFLILYAFHSQSLLTLTTSSSSNANILSAQFYNSRKLDSEGLLKKLQTKLGHCVELRLSGVENHNYETWISFNKDRLDPTKTKLPNPVWKTRKTIVKRWRARDILRENPGFIHELEDNVQGGHLQALHEFLSERIESCCSEQRNVDDELEDIFPTNLTGNHVGRNYKPNRLDDANQIAEKIVLKAEFNEFSLQEQKIEIDHIVSIQDFFCMLTGLAAVCWHKLDSKAPRGKTLRASVETLFQHSKNLVNSCSNLLPVPKEYNRAKGYYVQLSFNVDECKLNLFIKEEGIIAQREKQCLKRALPKLEDEARKKQKNVDEQLTKETLGKLAETFKNLRNEIP